MNVLKVMCERLGYQPMVPVKKWVSLRQGPGGEVRSLGIALEGGIGSLTAPLSVFILAPISEGFLSHKLPQRCAASPLAQKRSTI